ncbi:S-adenosyl-L-methionine-dependent methyltransferase [Pseudomassariella vexata]|uniref:S-adenosyl-L-methionine-dependent methyltransferase n=1 Tax=Pseudomassariella vexata TaxID=1141098 RepID=A0A1Y2DNL9_9PEZI|nr:S-adenosyl-L-methionine-dependent methyltransferase [Pseudomassariella vexata]ORY60736.1 S-adenosyl-L-methionine-dependent methyltransferase [Pseudomassariella vexata]
MLLEGRLGLAPVQSPEYVLDIATGTGIWALEYADQNPKSKVVGTDLSRIQPSPWVTNCSFERENSEMAEWLFPYKFDYIHLRAVLTCFDDITTVIKKSFDHMNAGGYIEFMDPGAPAFERWNELFAKGAAAIGRDMPRTRLYKDYLFETGFVDVVERLVPMPINPWPPDPGFKQMGRFGEQNMLKVIDSLRKLTGLAGLTPEATEELIAQAKREIGDRRNHTYFPWYVVYARKPHPWETRDMDTDAWAPGRKIPTEEIHAGKGKQVVP